LVSAQHLHGWGACRKRTDAIVGVIVGTVIPLPRAWQLASAMLVGIAVGQIAAIAASLLVKATIRPDIVIALVVGVPSVIGMLLILFSGRRWVTALGAFVLAIAPGWFGVLVAIQVVNGA
jgi:Putative holin